MCGICGVYNFDGGTPPQELLRTMNATIVHRGPDVEGYHFGGSVGLAMRRLSIIDLSTGHQPIANEDESIWIVYNGEIYKDQPFKLQRLKGRDIAHRGIAYMQPFQACHL